MWTRMIALLVMPGCAAALLAADLALPARVVVHEQATLNLVLSGAGEDLAGLQCDLEFDAGVMEIAIQPGPASSAAGKEVAVTTPAPGQRKLLVAGMNRTNLRDGIVVLLAVQIKAPTAGSYAIRILNAVGTTKDARVVPVGSSDGSVVVETVE
jgi:hypothetical protein